MLLINDITPSGGERAVMEVEGGEAPVWEPKGRELSAVRSVLVR